jgi:hypothetical protein
MFTDNSTAESAFHNGTSSSSLSFELVVRLQKIQLFHGVTIHLIHVSGKRMISQGTDGISCGNLLEVVMTGKDMLSFIPISQSACKRSSLMLNWLRSCHVTWSSAASVIRRENQIISTLIKELTMKEIWLLKQTWIKRERYQRN